MRNRHRSVKLLVQAASVFLLVAALAASVAAQAVSFLARRDFVGGGSAHVAIGDFNRDGIQDLVAADDSVSVLLGNWDGTFRTAMNFPGLTLAASVAVGDFNRDGIQDLAVAHSHAASILIGNADATFQTPVPVLNIGADPVSIAIGDFNKDGFQDLAIASTIGSIPGAVAPSSANVLLGNGDGSFQTARSFGTGRASSSLAIGDFNADGLQDLAVTNRGSNDVSILVGNGDGTFQPAMTFGTGLSPKSAAVGDFNGDGIQDLAVTNWGFATITGSVSILLGNSDGTFQPPLSFAAQRLPNSITVGEFNGDGYQDLVVANFGTTGPEAHMVSLYFGNGDGTFQAALDIGPVARAFSVAVGDFNGDGAQDLAVSLDSNSVSIVLGYGDGSFRSEQHFAAGPRPPALAVGDVNGDGIQDLAVTNWVSEPLTITGSVSILRGNGDGTFQPPLSFAARRFPTSIAVGEFNGDGYQDLAVANSGSVGPEAQIVSLFFGNGDGTFQAAQDIGPVARALSVAVGDFNNDKRQDLAVVHGGSSGPAEAIVSILLGNGNGTFQPAQTFGTGSGPSSVAIGDFNRDGFQDLAVSNQFSQSVSVLLGNGNGTFQPARDFELRSIPTSVAVGDFNGDGIQDLALSNRAFFDSGGVPIASILLGNGNGTFQPAQEFGPENRAESIVVGDFNRDGKQDLATANPNSDNVSVLLGNGKGSFQTAANFGAGDQALFLAVGDFNKDGAPDLAVANIGSDTVSILINDTRKLNLVNGLVGFQPRSSTFRTTTDSTVCPGFVATFRFDAALTNKGSSPSLADLIVEVATLTNGNLLQNADGGPSGVGALLSVPHKDGFLDGILSPQEAVDMPFVICLKNRQPFTFFVNVLGTEAGNVDNSLARRR